MPATAAFCSTYSEQTIFFWLFIVLCLVILKIYFIFSIYCFSIQFLYLQESCACQQQAVAMRNDELLSGALRLMLPTYSCNEGMLQPLRVYLP